MNMKVVLSIPLLFIWLTGVGQICLLGPAYNRKALVEYNMKRLHEMMVGRDLYIDKYIDDSLSYGHSNGWVENKKDFLRNLGKMMVYHSFREDSIRVAVNRKVAHARFIAD